MNVRVLYMTATCQATIPTLIISPWFVCHCFLMTFELRYPSMT